ncbi:MAG TPA: PfkB family carbohydrate kinase [Verrucomicrobiae bacterium]|nr:PfkB family carbohydrate kinase [Verrucomicrobiae bacterium]
MKTTRRNSGKRPAKTSPAATANASADSSADLPRLLDVVASFARQTIVVAGDMVLDEFVSGEISRVSREAPVLILRHRRTEALPGGAANAVNNLAALGARVFPVGVAGDDAGGDDLLGYFRDRRVNTSGIIRVRGWVTTSKTRYLAGWTHTTEQQVLRVDREPRGALPASVLKALAEKTRRLSARASAVLISDYGLGVVTPALVRGLKAKTITLDSRHNLLDYRDCGVTAATPNEPELEAAYHAQIGADTGKLEELGRKALRDLKLEALVVTRGKDGMAVFDKTEAGAADSHHIPIHGSDTPVDVTGAGDTVIAVFTLALAAGATYLEAAQLANYAGGIVVMKPRTATVTRAELETALRQDATALR